MKNILIFFSLIVVILFSCTKKEFIGVDRFVFSTDTISFDTIFTRYGSATLNFKVYNNSVNDINIHSISLANPYASPFRINVDGTTGEMVNNVFIPALDSIYIFVEVSLDPTNSGNPVLIEDSIVFEQLNHKSYVYLCAYGQDVVELRYNSFTGDSILNDFPYLLCDSLVVDENKTLFIEEGTTIYCKKNSSIIVNGNIEANGTIDQPIVFRGSRLDEVFSGYSYSATSSQWNGFTIAPSLKKNKFKNCRIVNGITAFDIGDIYTDERTLIDFENVVIHNNSYAGIFAINSKINMVNCQVTNNGQYNCAFMCGGEYIATHCTFSNYFGHDPSTNRKDEIPCFILANGIQVGEKLYASDITNSTFTNCIIDGNKEIELAFALVDEVGFQFSFSHCLIKSSINLMEDFPEGFISCYFNEDPGYKTIEMLNYDFRLDSFSFCIDKGTPSILESSDRLLSDLLGISRLTNDLPDIGAYEFEKID